MNIRERHDGVATVHLPHDHGAMAGVHTLCGLVDMPNTISDTSDPVDCETCMRALAHVLQLAADRGVIRSMPRKATRERARLEAKSP